MAHYCTMQLKFFVEAVGWGTKGILSMFLSWTFPHWCITGRSKAPASWLRASGTCGACKWAHCKAVFIPSPPGSSCCLGRSSGERWHCSVEPMARGLGACYRTAEIPQPSMTKEVTAASPAFSPGRGSAGKMRIEKRDWKSLSVQRCYESSF